MTFVDHSPFLLPQKTLRSTQTQKHITQMKAGPPSLVCSYGMSGFVLDQRYESRISHEKLEHSGFPIWPKTIMFHASFGCFQSNDSGNKHKESHCITISSVNHLVDLHLQCYPPTREGDPAYFKSDFKKVTYKSKVENG